MAIKPIQNMTDREIDTALAKMMGWFVDDDRLDKIPYYISFEGKGIMPVSDWHPHDDLNQVLQCENFIKDSEFVMDYCYALVKIVGQSFKQFVYATVRQRCEAMLMAMLDNKFKEG